MNQCRSSGRGAYKTELERIRIWVYNNQRHWFTAGDVKLNGQTLKAMAKRKLLKTSGRVGGKQAYEIRSGGWVNRKTQQDVSFG